MFSFQLFSEHNFSHYQSTELKSAQPRSWPTFSRSPRPILTTTIELVADDSRDGQQPQSPPPALTQTFGEDNNITVLGKFDFS